MAEMVGAPILTVTPEDALREVESALDAGDLLLAFDLADSYRTAFPECEAIRHKGLLGLARAGAVDQAQRLFLAWNLHRSNDADVLAVGARLKKDKALRAPKSRRGRAFLGAASAYRAIHARDPRYYLMINLASMLLLAGRVDAAREVAEQVLSMPEVARGADYYALATRAEAQIVLGRKTAAADSLTLAAAAGGSLGDRSTTIRQLRLLMSAQGVGEAEISDVLSTIFPPPVVHFRGDLGAGMGPAAVLRPEREPEVRARIARAIAEVAPSAAFGSLASSLEILFAEALLDAGARLELFLPFKLDDVIERAVRPAGGSWLERFNACVSNPQVRIACIGEDLDPRDASLFEYALRVAKGSAILRARHLEGEAVQIVLQDRVATSRLAESKLPQAAEISHWTCRNLMICADGVLDNSGAVTGESIASRPFCAVIFGDFPGFSRIGDESLPGFWSTVMAAIGEELRDRQEAVGHKATWGDAVHLVVNDVRTAAELSLALRDRLSRIDARSFGWEGGATMRIGAHCGPVFHGWDPILQQQTFFGKVLSKAARIEPVTPPGQIYVTDAFASILALEADADFDCTYVGRVPLAKGYGEFRMYDLAARIDW